MLAIVLSSAFASTQTAQAQTQTRDGAILGGVAGAVIGGVVGHQKDDTAEGALIGGAIGAVAGGVIGNQREQAARQRYYTTQHHHYHNVPVYREQHYYAAPAPVRTVEVRRPVTISEVINMTRSGVSDTVIVAHIQSNGVAVRPDVNDVILLNQEGVSDYVVTAMQQANTTYSTRTVSPAPVYRYPTQTVIVEEKYYPAPPRPVYSTPYRGRTTYYTERRGF